MPKNLYCNLLGSSPNIQNLESKIFAKYCKRLISKVSSRSRNVQVSVSSGVFAQSLALVSVSQRQYLVSVSKILAKTPALANKRKGDGQRELQEEAGKSKEV